MTGFLQQHSAWLGSPKPARAGEWAVSTGVGTAALLGRFLPKLFGGRTPISIGGVPLLFSAARVGEPSLDAGTAR